MAVSKRPPRKAAKDPFSTLRNDGPRPVYALDGLGLLVDEFVSEVRQLVCPVNAPAADFNFDLFTGKEAKLTRVLDAAKTLPAFAARRLVIVRQAHLLLEGRSVRDEDIEAVIRYLEHPSDTTTLIFIADKWDGRTKLYRAFKKKNATVRLEAPAERELPGVLASRAKTRGIHIEPEALRALLAAIGPDLEALVAALEQLHLFVGPESRRSIQRSDVEMVVSSVREESVFELVDAVSDESSTRALKGLHRLLIAQREPPLRLLALIARHYRHLIRARAAQDLGIDRRELASMLGIPPFAAQRVSEQAAKSDCARLARCLASIATTDRALKGGTLDDLRAVERLVFALRQDESLFP